MARIYKGHLLVPLFNVEYYSYYSLSELAQKYYNGSDNSLWVDINNKKIFEFCNNNPCEQNFVATYDNITELNTKFEERELEEIDICDEE